MSYDSGAKVSPTTPPHKTRTCPNFSLTPQPNTTQPRNVADKYVFTRGRRNPKSRLWSAGENSPKGEEKG